MFSVPKGYFHDKTVLILVCANFFMVAISTILIVLRLSRAETYLVEYRSNLGPLSQNTIGDATTFYIFILALISVALVSLFLSMRMYLEQRTFSVVVLGQSLLILVMATIVSDALLRAVS